MPSLAAGLSLGCPITAIAFMSAAMAALKLLLLHGPLIFFADRSSRLLLKKESGLPRAIAAMIVYFLAVNLGLWIVPRITYLELSAWSWLLGIAGLILAWKYRNNISTEPSPPPRSWIAAGGGLAIILLALALIVLALFAPHFDHDPLTYQLHFSAVWLSTGRLSIVPTPFGDPSQAYGPALASAFYVWLMAPLNSDLLAQAGGWAFFVLAIICSIGLARELGAREGYAWTAGLFASLCPLVLYESNHALSDFPVAAFFSAALYFFLRVIKTGDRAELALALCSAGLMVGSKYTAAGLLTVLLPFAALAGFRARGRAAWRAWAAGTLGAVAGGGEWYLRNFYLAGNPVFPIRISLGGWEIFPGLYGRAEMKGWIFYKSGWLEWLHMVEANASLVLLLLFLAAMIAMLVFGLKSLKTGGSADQENPRLFGAAMILMALTPLLVDRICWWLFPFQVYRFWLPAVPALAAMAAWFYTRRPALLIGAVALVGLGFWVRPALGYLGLFVQVWPRFGWPILLAASFGLAFLYDRFWARKGRGGVPAWGLAIIVCIGAMSLTVSGLRDYETRRQAALTHDWEFGKGWASLPCPDSGIIVAYTGANVPYPLHGPRLQNRVLYVSPSGRVMPRDHELMKELGNLRFMTPEPVVSGLRLCPQKWAQAMLNDKVDVLFVMRMPRNPLVNSVHDKDGWPIEDSWARECPGFFKLAQEDEDHKTRIYFLDPGRADEIARLAPDCVSRPPDAPTACLQSLDLCNRFFPRAVAALKDMHTLNWQGLVQGGNDSR